MPNQQPYCAREMTAYVKLMWYQKLIKAKHIGGTKLRVWF